MAGSGSILQEPKKLVGASIPRQLASHLSLISVVESITVTDILKELILTFVATYDGQELMQSIKNKALESWENRVKVNEKHENWKTNKRRWDRWAEFKFELGSSLKKKGVSLNDIGAILALMDQDVDLQEVK